MEDTKNFKVFKVNRKLWRPIREIIIEMNVDVPYLKLIEKQNIDKPHHNFIITGHLSGVYAH